MGSYGDFPKCQGLFSQKWLYYKFISTLAHDLCRDGFH
jgi:hypothetical protein